MEMGFPTLVDCASMVNFFYVSFRLNRSVLLFEGTGNRVSRLSKDLVTPDSI
ncbi:MAG TPA: hypothetical protein VMS89_05620 [Methanoregulaceae archaeon]|nr:hypothetical protein [Methanoregulaceae archaeon]